MTQQNPVRIVQLSDCHLLADPEDTLYNVHPARTLQAVLTHLAAAADRQDTPTIHTLIITGDITENGDPAAYQWLDHTLQPLSIPHAWLPGNHDDLIALTAIKPASYPQVIPIANWQLILLDSTKTGHASGYLADKQQQALANALKHTDSPTLLFMHHPPFSIGSACMDRMMLQNPDDLFNLITPSTPRETQASNVKAIGCGHVHQPFSGSHRDIQLFSAPSTFVQYTPKSADFQITGQPPGYRWYDLYPDGHLISGIEYLRKNIR